MLYPQKIDREFHTLTIRVTPTLHDTINDIARRNGETVAAIVRQMLRSGVEQRQGFQMKPAKRAAIAIPKYDDLPDSLGQSPTFRPVSSR